MAQEQRKILVVDDDEDIIRFIETLLNDEYQIITCKTVSEAVEATKREKPSIVIVDYKMPIENGFDFLDKVKDLKSNLISIMLTGYGDKETILGSIRRGVYAFLEKPINFDELSETVASAASIMRQKESDQSAVDRSRATQHLATVGYISAHIMHEIANPIMALSGYISKLKNVADEKHFDQATKDIIGRMENMCVRIAKTARNTKAIIHDLNASPERASHNLSEIVNEALEICEMQMTLHNVKFTCSLNPKLMAVCNQVGTLQVLINLIINSIQAISALPERWISIVGDVENNMIVLRIKDSGPGIPTEVRSRIFDEFFSTKPVHDGSGLGLSTAKRVMEEENLGKLYYDEKSANTCFVASFVKG